jgi:DNA (cytosine-5)-methyltransferase 1
MQSPATKSTTTSKSNHHFLGNPPHATNRVTPIAHAARAALADPFNADGVVEKPSFTMTRDIAAGELISVTLYAHRVAGQWIACTEWTLNAAPYLGDCEIPARKHKRHPLRLAAVDPALNGLAFQVENQLGELALDPKWAKELASLRQWIGKVHEEILAADAAILPLANATTIELFAGTGVASQAFRDQGATSKLVVEIDKHALTVCQQAVKPAAVHRDILTFNGKGQSCDFLIIGAPCTAHSKGGNSRGTADKSVGPTHHAAMNAVRDVDFKVAIVECAADLLTPKFKADADLWRHAFMRRGCRVQHRIIDAADFGVPQNRLRSIIIATRGDVNVDEILGFVFPKGQPRETMVEDILQPNVADDQHLGSIQVSEVVWHTEKRRSRCGLNELGRVDGMPHQGYRVYHPKAIGPTMTATGGGRAPCTGAYLIGGKVRGLTAREACRMNGLPEWFEHDPDTRRALKQAGNALAYPLFQALGTQLASVLKPRT